MYSFIYLIYVFIYLSINQPTNQSETVIVFNLYAILYSFINI